jgi:Putative Actinobacterial Holin-X, holin superfamily III
MADQTDIAEVIKNIQADVTAIVRGEIELAKAELIPQAKAAGIGAGLFTVAAVVGLTGLTVLLLGLSFWLSFGFQTWFHLDLLPSLAWGFATIAILFFLVAGALALMGKNQLKFTGAKETAASADATVAAVKGAVELGLEDVEALSLTGRRPELEA